MDVSYFRFLVSRFRAISIIVPRSRTTGNFFFLVGRIFGFFLVVVVGLIIWEIRFLKR